MKWVEVSPEEAQQLEYSTKSGGKVSQYAALLEAVKSGKVLRVELGEAAPKSMSQRIYTAAKAQGIKVSVRLLADKSAVVVAMNPDPEPVAEQKEEAVVGVVDGGTNHQDQTRRGRRDAVPA